MKFLSIFPLFCLSLFSLRVLATTTPIRSIVDLMKETPAYINGSFTFASATNLMRDTSGVIPKTLQMKAKPVGFFFDEHSLNLNTRGALYFWLGGIKCKINSISYNDKTGSFAVSADTPLGLFDGNLERKVKEAIEERYKAKLQNAFRELRRIRQNQTVDQAKESIQAIISALSEGGNGPQFPTISGDVALNFRPERNRRIMLTEKIGADVRAGDDIKIGATFTLRNHRTTFQTVNFESNQGIRISGSTRWPEIKSVNLKQVGLDPRGLSVNYAVGAEEVIQGLILTLNLVTSGNGRNKTSLDCLDDVELTAIRRQIDQTFLSELSILLRQNRQALINAGVNPRLINALD